MRKWIKLLAVLLVLPICWAILAQPYGGGQGPYPSGGSTGGTTITNNNAVNLTNILQIRSIDIPIGAWTTNGVDSTIAATITAAQFASVTNAGDGLWFAHTNGTSAVTNAARTLFGLPWDWDAGTVKIQVSSVCDHTNSSVATNIVYAIRAVALSGADNLTNITFGSFVRVTNNVGTNAWVVGQDSVTAALTVGNSPTSQKSILWEIQRHGGDGGDTETNAVLFLRNFRVYYKTASLTNFPTSSP